MDDLTLDLESPTTTRMMATAGRHALSLYQDDNGDHDHNDDDEEEELTEGFPKSLGPFGLIETALRPKVPCYSGRPRHARKGGMTLLGAQVNPAQSTYQLNLDDEGLKTWNAAQKRGVLLNSGSISPISSVEHLTPERACTAR
jgi:hypothetical protein